MTFRFDDAAALLTAEEVAQLLRLKAATVYEAASKGRIPCIRLWEGTRRALIRFSAKDIEQIIRERSFPSSSDVK
jgi:excisionase family DNA binding protein